jgi:pyridoxamine 5'-phosphate oxidase
MPQTPWRASLVLALYRNRDAAQSRFMQLATVRADGCPANRTVVFRGFLADSHQLTMVSDIRSDKFKELGSNSWAEVCWFFPRTREQFRLAGCVTAVGEASGEPALQEARRDAWRTLTDSTRQSFTWPVPGESRDAIAAFLAESPASNSPLPCFGLLVLDPCRVDHLELDGNPQSRWISRRDDHSRWTSHEVNP